jgi:hypothetical protein
VTAVIALTNTATLQALAALTRAGLSVPDEMSLVGFDDYPWMQVAPPPLTVVRQPIAAMGEAVWSRLRDRISGAGAGSFLRTHSAELIRRDSTAPPRRDVAEGHRAGGKEHCEREEDGTDHEGTRAEWAKARLPRDETMTAHRRTGGDPGLSAPRHLWADGANRREPTPGRDFETSMKLGGHP